MRSYNVSGMSCAACSARVEKAVSGTEGVSSCSVNLLTNSMTVEGTATDEAIIAAVVKAGYGASPKGAENKKNVNNNSQKDEQRGITARLIASVALLVPLMYLSMGHVMWGWPLPAFLSGNAVAIAILQMLISGLVLVINQRFFISGISAVINRSPNMDTLVSLGSGVSYIYSIAITLMMSAAEHPDHYLHQLYFESAAMILALITVGKMLEARAKGKTTDAINSLLKLAPRTATVVRDGRELTIPAAEVRVGDVFLVRPGESVPVDGVVLEGHSSIDESALTGESVPVDKSAGDHILAATQNTSGFMRCEATKVGDDTAIASVIRMVEDASASKAPIAKIADRVSGIFVPAVILVALVTFGAWMIINGDVGGALSHGISVLVISCPCALGLATPVAIMVGSGVGARLGVLFKSAEALELTGRARTVALDKTGTITCGKPQVVSVICDKSSTEKELLSIAYAIEKQSEHPLAKAVADYAKSYSADISVSDFRALAGSGVYCKIQNSECTSSTAVGGPPSPTRFAGEGNMQNEIYGGSYKFISTICDLSAYKADYDRLTAEGKTPLFFTRDGAPLGLIAVADTVREDSAEAIADMKAIGLRVVMLTGDNSRTAEAIGRAAGVDEVIAELLPDGKEAAIRALSEKNTTVMVGDGINDAPALTRADVGMAIGGGTDIAIESADVVLMRDSLSDVVDAIRLGRSVLRNIHQNLFWAFCYNIIGIPLAAGLFGLTLNPMFGAAAMSLSSVTVVTNALRLNTFKSKYNKKHIRKEKKPMKITMKIEGMMCPHCEARVRDVLSALPCVESAEVSHKDDMALVTPKGDCPREALISAVEGAGYKVISVE
ncbi:MAG: heavy metal translocating P-type ATPase [Clostridia bacterium]|nr:heavy metal translocating P-type ATPase [Clostridia bacterium]